MIQSQIIVYILLVITTSVIVGYLSEQLPSSKRGTNGNVQQQEGFQGTEQSVSSLNDNMSEKVTDLDDSLQLTKYKNKYENTLVYGKDYFESMKVSSLFDFKAIVKNQSDREKTIDASIELAKKLGALNRGAVALANTKL
jgi:hypothetical protein